MFNIHFLIIFYVLIFDFVAYATLYFMYMLCIPVFWVNFAAYTTELYTSKWRFCNYLIGCLPINPLVFSLILYLNRTFTGIHLWGGIATMVILPFYFIIPESPRWLAQNNKEEEALKVLLQMAKFNNRYQYHNVKLIF